MSACNSIGDRNHAVVTDLFFLSSYNISIALLISTTVQEVLDPRHETKPPRGPQLLSGCSCNCSNELGVTGPVKTESSYKGTWICNQCESCWEHRSLKHLLAIKHMHAQTDACKHTLYASYLFYHWWRIPKLGHFPHITYIFQSEIIYNSHLWHPPPVHIVKIRFTSVYRCLKCLMNCLWDVESRVWSSCVTETATKKGK